MSDKRIDKVEPRDDKDDPRNRLNLVDEYVPPGRPGTPSTPVPLLKPDAGRPAEVPTVRLPVAPDAPAQVDLLQMTAQLHTDKLRTQSVDDLARMYLANPDGAKRSVDEAVSRERSRGNDLLTDIGATGIGLVTKFGLDKALAKGPGWTRPIGFIAGAGAAGLSKSLLTDGELGTGTEFLRGAGVYGGSVLMLKGMALNPSRATLGASTLEGLSARTGVSGLAGTSAQVSEQLLAGGAGGSTIARAGQYLNPLNYTGLTWNNGLRFAGFGGEASAALVAEGGMSVAAWNARRNIGQVATRFGSAYGLGAGREALYISTGQTTADGGAYDLQTALSEINSSGLKLGATAAFLMPAAGTAARIIPGGSRVLDAGASTAGWFSVTGAATAEALLPAAAVGGYRAYDHETTAKSIEVRSAHARALIERAKSDDRMKR